jgi:beta-glucosidase
LGQQQLHIKSKGEIKINGVEFNWIHFLADWEDTPGKIKNGDKSGKACEHWTRYKEDIALMKTQLGVSMYRFSVEWSRFQPNSETDEFDTTVIQHYHDVIDECLAQNLTPVVTLHHFSNPIWFQKMGSFEKEENIIFFENFCEKVFVEYKDKVKIWCTINEPEIYTLCGYLDGNSPGCFPPGKVNLFTAITVLKHLMIAHTNVYVKLKAIDPDAMIGLAKNYCRARPWSSWNPIEFVSAWGFNTFRDTCILRYFKTGYFYIPFLVNYYNPEGKKCLDYLGMNYYGDCWLYAQYGFKIGNEWREIDKPYMTDMDYPMYACGFYDGLKELSKVGVPIIVTENGCADAKDAGIRDTWIKRYTYAMVKALQEGVDIRGYTYWSFCDNFEWGHGFKMRFGLYHVDYKTQTRTLRNGSKFFIDLIGEYKKLIQ